MKQQKLLSAFTLVELMVVVSIIAILSAIVYANFSNARAAARDDARKAALKEVQLALEVYKAQNGKYPAGCNGYGTWSGNPGSQWECSDIVNKGTNNFIIGLTPDFIAELPMEKNVDSNTAFIYKSVNGTGYKLMAHKAAEVKFVTSYADEFARCPNGLGTAACPTVPVKTHYAVYSSIGAND